MPRIQRADTAGLWCHILNRGNGRQQVFWDDEDYLAFLELIGEAQDRDTGGGVRILGFSLMPTHFHLVARPRAEGSLSRWMQWLMTSHVRRHHRRYGTSGHVWQGPFKSFPIQPDRVTRAEREAGTLATRPGIWTVLRYVERNALRAGLVEHGELWPWSSLHFWARGKHPRLAGRAKVGLPREEFSALTERVTGWLARGVAGGDDRPARWLDWVNRAEDEAELAALRRCVQRGRPFGTDRWVKMLAERLGLESTVRPRGRPRKRAE